MTILKNPFASLFIFLICIAMVYFGSFAPDMFDKLSMKFYGSYISFDEYVNRMIRANVILIFINLGVLIYVHILVASKRNLYYRALIYFLLVLQGFSNINILLKHYKYNVFNPSEMSVFYQLTNSFGWIAHAFYFLPLLSFILGIVFRLIYLMCLPSRIKSASSR